MQLDKSGSFCLHTGQIAIALFTQRKGRDGCWSWDLNIYLIYGKAGSGEISLLEFSQLADDTGIQMREILFFWAIRGSKWSTGEVWWNGRRSLLRQFGHAGRTAKQARPPYPGRMETPCTNLSSRCLSAIFQVCFFLLMASNPTPRDLNHCHPAGMSSLTNFLCSLS